MEIKPGNLYFIKDSFFEKVDDPFLKKDHETTKRPHYFAIKDKDTSLYWLIPVSSKVDKYEKLIEKKKERNKPSDGIKIVQIRDEKRVLLFQDMFPVIENYIKEPYIKGGQPVCIESKNFVSELNKIAFGIKSKLQNGIKFTPTQPDIRRIEKMMLEELQQKPERSQVQGPEIQKTALTMQENTALKQEENGHTDPSGTACAAKSKKKEINDSAHSTKNISILDRIKTEKERMAEKAKTEPTKTVAKKNGHEIDD